MSHLELAIKAAKKAGKLILKRSKSHIHISEKNTNDLVTDVDRESEELIIKMIKNKYPDDGIIAEESQFENEQSLGELSESEYIWIIDPIDGTRNFVRNIPTYCVSIGVFQNKISNSSKNYKYISGELIAGVVYAPAIKELFYAEKGKGAYFNDQKISVSKATKLEKTLFATGFPPQHRERNLPYFNSMVQHTGGIRRLGSAALDLCYVAAGRIDGFWEFGLSAWDIAAGALIVSEAGGTVTDTNGEAIDLFGGDILATNGQIHKPSVDLFEKIEK